MYLHHIPVLQDFGLVDLLAFKAAVAPEAGEPHSLRQVAMNLAGKVRNCGADG